MKRLGLEIARVAGVLLCLWTAFQFVDHRAKAVVSCSVPFTFVNGTVADATQVDANFNSLITCLGNAAAAGVNTDITQLAGLSVPLSPTQGGSNNYMGGTVTGTGNAMVMAAPTPNNFTLTTGYSVSFVSPFNNSAATTVNVNGTGVKNLFRKTQVGSGITQGGEIFGGGAYRMTYDGTEYVLDGETFYVGEIKDMLVTSAPTGYVAAGGQAISRTTFSALFAFMGTVCGTGDGSTTFNVCDYRGVALAGYDNLGGTAANRLTNAATGCGTTMQTFGTGSGTTLCANGNQSHTQVSAELAAHNHGITDNGHTHNLSVSGGFFVNSGGAAVPTTSGGSGSFQNPANAATNSTTGITVNNTAAATAMAIVQPVGAVMKMIRY